MEQTEEKKTAEKQKKKQRILNLVILAGICVIALCIWHIVSVQNQYRSAEEAYDNLRNQYVTAADTDDAEGGSAEHQETDTGPGIQVDLQGLQRENPDIIGWLYYEPAGISYPILQDDDNTYYINHTYAGERNSTGSIFLDAWNSSDFSDPNTFIYGHNMRNGSMFGALSDIREEGTVREHPCFWILTEQGWHRYDIFSYYEADTSEDSFTIQFQDATEYEAFLISIVNKSEEALDVTVGTQDRIVTLSTCTSDSSVRFLVHGVLVRENKDTGGRN